MGSAIVPWRGLSIGAVAFLVLAAAVFLSRRHYRAKEAPAQVTGSERKELSPDEREDVERYVRAIEPAARGWPVQVSAELIAATDVWVGTQEEGLFRYDRDSGRWRSYKESGIGHRIKHIWQEGSAIWVEHEIWGNHTYCYVDFTEDRGRTWTCFLIGDASGRHVHAPEFTNRCFRTERLQKITAALRKGIHPEELVEHIRVEQDVYFTIYVNSSDGWCALYRYDVSDDRLTDLAMAQRDPEAVGVREFYLDPHEKQFIWILTGGYGGALQTPSRWFRYDRTSRAMLDTGVSYRDADPYVVESDAERPYLDIIRFEPEQVLLLGRRRDGSLEPIGCYDRKTKRFR